ncbi:MAG: hypothetical protein WC595_03470 [Candidatus Nanoarchaeia archaeon]
MKKIVWPLAIAAGIGLFSVGYGKKIEKESQSPCVAYFARESTNKSEEFNIEDRTKIEREACERIYQNTSSEERRVVDEVFLKNVGRGEIRTSISKDLALLRKNKIALTSTAAEEIILKRGWINGGENNYYVERKEIEERFPKAKELLEKLGKPSSVSEIIDLAKDEVRLKAIEGYQRQGCKIDPDASLELARDIYGRVDNPTIEFHVSNNKGYRNVTVEDSLTELATSTVEGIDCYEQIIKRFKEAYRDFTGEEASEFGSEAPDATNEEINNFLKARTRKTFEIFKRYETAGFGKLPKKKTMSIINTLQEEDEKRDDLVLRYVELHNKYGLAKKGQKPKWSWDEFEKANLRVKGAFPYAKSLEEAIVLEERLLESGRNLEPSLEALQSTASRIVEHGAPDAEGLKLIATSTNTPITREKIVLEGNSLVQRYLALGKSVGIKKTDPWPAVPNKPDQIDALERTLDAGFRELVRGRGEIDWMYLANLTNKVSHGNAEKIVEGVREVDAFFRSKGYQLNIWQLEKPINSIKKGRLTADLVYAEKIVASQEKTLRRMSKGQKEIFIGDLTEEVFEFYDNGFEERLRVNGTSMEEYERAMGVITKYSKTAEVITPSEVKRILVFEKLPRREKDRYLSYFHWALGEKTLPAKVVKRIISYGDIRECNDSLGLLRYQYGYRIDKEEGGLNHIVGNPTLLRKMTTLAYLRNVRVKMDRDGLWELYDRGGITAVAEEFLANPHKRFKERTTMNVSEFLGNTQEPVYNPPQGD